MDMAGFKPQVPRLLFFGRKESQDLMSGRSDLDDLFPTSYRDQIEKPQENLEGQIDRLNQILETVLCSINPMETPNVSEMRQTDETFYEKKSGLEPITSFVIKEQSDSSRSETFEMLKQVKNEEEMIEVVEKFLMSAISASREKFGELEITNRIESGLNFIVDPINYCHGISAEDLIDNTSRIIKKEESFTIDSKMIKQEASYIEDISLFPKFADKFGEIEFGLSHYKKFVKYLAQQISQLSGKNMKFEGSCPEIELPELSLNILKEISAITTREKDLELREKSLPSLNISEKLQVACSYEEIISIHERLSEILIEISELGTNTEHLIKVGLLSIGISVYFSEDCKAKYYTKYIGEIKESHIFNFDERLHSLLRATPPSINALSDRSSNKTVTQASNNQDLQEKIIELTRQIVNLEEINEMNEELSKSIREASEARIFELEELVDKLMFDNELKEKQIQIYKKGKYVSASQSFESYAEKYKELREKELLIKKEWEKLELEKQKLVKQTIDLYCSKQISEVENLKSNRINESRDQSTHAFIEFQEISTQTDQLKLEDIENIASLNEMPEDNYSRLESYIFEEDPECATDNIRLLKKKINEIHTKQALLFTEKSIDYAEKKLDIIEKELKKTSRMQSAKADDKLLRELKKKNDRLEKGLENLQGLLKNPNGFNIDLERAKLINEKINLQQQQACFNQKRKVLKQKIIQVNERQKQLVEMEENLSERKIQLTVQSKKQECFKQAIEEEWARIDSKRQDVLKCQAMIDDEWKALMEEVHYFEKLKNEEQDYFSSRNCSGLLEKLSEIEENALKIEMQHNLLENAKKKVEEEKNRLTEEWKKLEQEKSKVEAKQKENEAKAMIFKRESKDLQTENIALAKEKVVLKENTECLNSLGPKLRRIIY